MKSPTAVFSTVDAMPRPASCGVPRWPTIVESMTVNSGSAIRAPREGSASARIIRVVIVGVDEAGSPSRFAGEVGSLGPCVLVMTLRFFSTMCAQACGKPCTGKF